MLSSQGNRNGPTSKEEEDLLKRSSKKIKNVVAEERNDLLKGHWPKLGDIQPVFNEGGTSFADKLKGVDRDDVVMDSGKNDDLLDDSLSDFSPEEDAQGGNDWKCKISESLSRNFPTFQFSDKMK
ncbi:hypothetical protein QN277_011636 [Acacia crassicarpa]|uniref:Uncharacterized protein n=1 Tax=Acacia crassicarpa TaxID=499986 RepID=A0AAE1MZ73_9FABA|nr:hypothetical protein QN277_011636 [Acacia crassicarpa]